MVRVLAVLFARDGAFDDFVQGGFRLFEWETVEDRAEFIDALEKVVADKLVANPLLERTDLPASTKT